MLQIRDFTQQATTVPEYIKKSKTIKTCQSDDVLIARYGASLGKILTGLSGAYNVAIMKTIPDTTKLEKKYLFYYLTSQLFQGFILNVGSRAAQAGFNKNDLNDLLIPLPPLPEQRHIAAVLDKVSELIALRKRQLDLLDEMVKARFVEMFGDCKLNPKKWNTIPLEDISDVGSSKRVFVEELKDTGIPFYRGTEIGALAEGKSFSPQLFITTEHYNELIAMSEKPSIGDLLMPSICPDGRIWVVDNESPFYFKDGRVLWVHPFNKSFNSIFLLYTLKDRIMTDYSSIASGTTFAELKIFSLKQCRIFDVPIELQNQFADFVRQVDKSKATVQQGLDRLNLLKSALMQEYFG